MNNDVPNKKTFLAVYDYGTGGVWLLFNAVSKSQIEDLYPELEVYEDKPEWMDTKLKQEFVEDCISFDMHWDIDKTPTGWLKTLIDDRNKK